MEQNIKTIEDVKKFSATERIDMMNRDNYTCPFCGAPLRGEIVGFGRDKCTQYHHCTCPTAQAAEAHNKRIEEAEHKAWLRRRKIAEAKERRAEQRRKEAKAKKPVTLTASEVLCILSGYSFPGLWYKGTLEKVEEALYYRREPIFEAKNAQKGLIAFAKTNGFDEELEKAAAVMAEYVQRPDVTEDTDISEKVAEVCADYGLPTSFTL